MPAVMCYLCQQTFVKTWWTDVGSARVNLVSLNPHHLLQFYVVWVECPAVYANKKCTAWVASLTIIIWHQKCDNVIGWLSENAAHVQCRVRIVERPVQKPQFAISKVSRCNILISIKPPWLLSSVLGSPGFFGLYAANPGWTGCVSLCTEQLWKTLICITHVIILACQLWLWSGDQDHECTILFKA